MWAGRWRIEGARSFDKLRIKVMPAPTGQRTTRVLARDGYGGG